MEVLFLVAILHNMFYSPINKGFIKPSRSTSGYDSFEGYSYGVFLNGLNLTSTGISNSAYFNGPYIDKTGFVGLQAFDSMETYAANSLLDTLNGGSGWSGSFVDRTSAFNYILSLDTMESYTVSSSLDGLNGGTGWNGAFVSR